MSYFIGAPTKPKWRMTPEDFIAKLLARWPEARVRKRSSVEPSAEQIYKANASAPLKPVTKEGPSWNFQRRICGPVEYLFKGGGEQVQADGPITSDGLVLDAKHVGKPKKSPFIQTSGMKYNIRQWINEDLEEEFQRYAAVIADPNTPIVGLKVITNDRRAVAYFLGLMKKYGIPGRIVFKMG